MARKTNGSTAPNRKPKALAAAASVGVPQTEQVKTLQDSRREDEIRRRAYEIYLERNGSPGDEYQDWLSAEREILARH